MSDVNKETAAELRERYQFQIALNNILYLSLQDISLEEMLAQVLIEITSVPWLGVEPKGAIFLVGDEPGKLIMVAQRGLAPPLLTACASVPFGHCLCGRAALSKEIIFVDKLDAQHETTYEEIKNHGHYCIPILNPKANKLLGVVNFYVKAGFRLAENEEGFFLPALSHSLAGMIERKQAEAALKESEKQYKSLFENAGDAIFLIEAKGETAGQIVAANKAAAKTHGYTVEELLGMKITQLDTPETAWEAPQRMARMLKGEWIDEEITHQRKDGSVFPVQLRAGLVEVSSRPCFLAFDVDITERKRAEEALETEHRRLERTFFSLSSALISLDENDRVVQWNAAAERTFGIPASQVLGKTITESGLQWNWLELLSLIFSSLKQNQPVRLDELHFQDALGRERYLGLTVSAIKDEAGKHRELLLLGSDVTDYKLLGAQLVQAQKLESIGQLAAGIAHEINTPMQYVGDNTHFLQNTFGDLVRLIRSYQNLLREAQAGHDIGDLAREIETLSQANDVEFLLTEVPVAIAQTLMGIERVTKIVRAMKEFSHPGDKVKKPIELNRALENTINVSRNEWKYLAEMVTDFAPNLPLVNALEGELNQVFLNIIVNATHAIGDIVSQSSGKKGVITISTRQDNDWVEIRIKDTGAGIPENVRSKIFDPFFTTKEVGRGTGQGLTISRSVIVEKHQGTLTFESEMGQGTTFIIRLPLNLEAAEEDI